MGFRGIDIRQSGDRLLFRASLKDSAGAKLTTGTTTLRLFELQNDGTLKSYDFNDNTFKTTALTTATLAMTHRTGNNGTYNTGIWTVGVTTVSGFTKDNIYIAQVSNTGATPAEQEREFQYGNSQGDVDPSFHRATEGITDITVGSGSTPTSVVCSAAAPAPTVTDQFKGLILAFSKNTTTAALRGQKTDITSSTSGATPTLTVTALTTSPVSGDIAVIE